MIQRPIRIDFTSVAGVVLGLGFVLAGQSLEGGGLGAVLQLTAAVIVFGGTLGAVLVSFSLDEVSLAARRLQAVFVDESTDPARLVRRIVNLAAKARRNGITTIENELVNTDAPFLRKGLMLVGDGNDPQAVRELLEVEDNAIVERESVAALVYESAGGYAPTFGILGAVMELIQVMEHLTDPGRLGAGIAVAFVATIYGVGSANLIFLPIATKLRTRSRRATRHRELILEGVLAIQAGSSPRFVQAKLEGFLDDDVEVGGPRLRGRAA